MPKKLSVVNGISLFTGSGIGEFALRKIIPGYRTVCYVEWDKYCQDIIKARIRDGAIDDAPIWDDVKTFDGKQWAGKVDFISGGFPCQPFSVAGKGEGETDERNMWPDTFRVISEVRPRYAFLENVPGLFSPQWLTIKGMEKIRQTSLFDTDNQKSVSGRYNSHYEKLMVPGYIGRVFGDLSKIGYDCQWDVVSAAYVGAKHLRKRLWIIAQYRG